MKPFDGVESLNSGTVESGRAGAFSRFNGFNAHLGGAADTFLWEMSLYGGDLIFIY
jgi:hypothetical protein